MASKIPTVYSFSNATLIRWNGQRSASDVILLEDGEALPESTKELSRETRELLGLSSYRFHGGSTGKLQLIESKWSQTVESYVPRDGSPAELRELSAEDYERLSARFQKLYERRLAEPEETRVELDFELRSFAVELSEDVILGRSSLTELHGMVFPVRDRKRKASSYGWSSSDGPRADLDRNLPVELTSSELLSVVELIGSKIRKSRGYLALVSLDSSSPTPGGLRISFLEERYEGAMRKVLDKKSNGQPYADRRGHLVKDHSTVVGSAVISLDEVRGWWDSIGGAELSDEGKLEALTELTHHLWRL